MLFCSLRTAGSSALILASLAIVGCGQKTVDVSGKVTIEGKPMQVGSVAVFPDNARPMVAAVEADGSFRLKDVPASEPIRVAVYSPDPAIELQNLPSDPEADRDRELLKAQKQRWIRIPNRYNDPFKSGLSIDPSTNGEACLFDLRP